MTPLELPCPLPKVESYAPIVAKVLESAVAQALSLCVVVDVPYVVKQARRLLQVELDPTVTGVALSEVAPQFGFTAKGQDSDGRLQWQAQNPRLAWCSRHRRIGRAVVVRERMGVFGLRVRHGPHSCRLSLIHEETLAKCLPSLIHRDPLIRHVVAVTLAEDAPRERVRRKGMGR